MSCIKHTNDIYNIFLRSYFLFIGFGENLESFRASRRATEIKFNTRAWPRSVQCCFSLHWNMLDHGTLELGLFGLSCTQIVQSSRVQSSLRTLCTRGCTCIVQQMGSAALARPPAGRIDRIKKCLADAEVRRGRESRAMNGRGEEGDRGARHGSRRRDSPGPLKSETAQSSCPRPLVQATVLRRVPRPRLVRLVRRP